MTPPTQRTVRSRFLTVLDAATPDETALGALWYPDARLVVDQYSLGRSHRVAGAVCAALSPQLSWEKNLEAYRHFMVSRLTIAGVLGRSYANAVAVLDADDPDRVALGPALKTRAFAANLAGDDEAVTVDRHMFDVAANAKGSGDTAWAKRQATYEELAAAVRWVASQRGISPATAQATIWQVWKNRVNRRTSPGTTWKDLA